MVYSLFVAALVMLGAKLGKRIGSRLAFQIGALVHGLAMLGMALSRSVPMMIQMQALAGVGAALLTPFVPKKVAGAALGAFSAGLLSMYFRNPAMTESDGIRPSQEGLALSKDAFMLAIAGALVTDK